MHLATDVKHFTSACEHLLATVSLYGPLDGDEARIVEYYCKEVLVKAVPFQTTCEAGGPLVS